MKKLNKLAILFMLLVLTTSHLNSQQPAYEQVCGQTQEYCEDDSEIAAYEGTQRAAHWSAYVPIGALIVAAVFFGIADRKHGKKNANDSFYHGNTLGTPPSLSSELGG